MSSKKFKSLNGLSKISTTIIEDVAWFNIDKLDALSGKMFFYLLKDVIEYFKENNIEYVKQYVNSDTLSSFKTSSFVEVDDDVYIISTKLSDFPKEVAYALGINLL